MGRCRLLTSLLLAGCRLLCWPAGLLACCGKPERWAPRPPGPCPLQAWGALQKHGEGLVESAGLGCCANGSACSSGQRYHNADSCNPHLGADHCSASGTVLQLLTGGAPGDGPGRSLSLAGSPPPPPCAVALPTTGRVEDPDAASHQGRAARGSDVWHRPGWRGRVEDIVERVLLVCPLQAAKSSDRVAKEVQSS